MERKPTEACLRTLCHPHFSCKKPGVLRSLHGTLKEEDALLPTLHESLRKSVASKRRVGGGGEDLEVVPPYLFLRQQLLLPLSLVGHIQPPSESKPALSRFCTMIGPGTPVATIVISSGSRRWRTPPALSRAGICTTKEMSIFLRFSLVCLRENCRIHTRLTFHNPLGSMASKRCFSKTFTSTHSGI